MASEFPLGSTWLPHRVRSEPADRSARDIAAAVDLVRLRHAAGNHFQTRADRKPIALRSR